MKLKRLLSALLATIMVVSQLPVLSFAADAIDVNGVVTSGSQQLIYFKYVRGAGTGDDNGGSGGKSLPMNLNSPQENDHTQMIIPATFDDEKDSSKTFVSQKGKYITKLEFILNDHYHTTGSSYKGGLGSSGHNALKELTENMKQNIQLGDFTLSLGTTTEAAYSSNGAYITTGLTEVAAKAYIIPYDHAGDTSSYGNSQTGGDNDWKDVLIIELEKPFYYDGNNIVIDIVMGDNWDAFAQQYNSGKLSFYWREFGNNCSQYKICLDKNGNIHTGLPRTKIYFQSGTENVTLTPGTTVFEYDGTPKTPTFTLADNVNGGTISASKYTLEYFDAAGNELTGAPKDPGEYVLHLHFTEGYTGVKSIDFTINPGSGGDSGGDNPALGNETKVYFTTPSYQPKPDEGKINSDGIQIPVRLWTSKSGSKGYRVQMMYPASYVDTDDGETTFGSQGGKYITKLEFPMVGTFTDADNNNLCKIKVSLGTSNKTIDGHPELTSIVDGKDATSDYIDELTEVFNDTPKIKTSDIGPVLVIDFSDDPFLYTGNNESIIVDIEMQSESKLTTSGSFKYFWYGSNYCMTIGGDTTSGTSSKARAQASLPLIRMTFAEIQEKATVSYDPTEQLVADRNGKVAVQPTVSVQDSKTETNLTLGTDYTVSFNTADGNAPTTAGSYVMTITFIGDYADVKAQTISFIVQEPADPNKYTDTVYVTTDVVKTGVQESGWYSMAVDLWGKTTGNHFQTMYPADFFDATDDEKTLGSKKGNSITKLEFVLSGSNFTPGPVTGFDITVSLGTSNRRIPSIDDDVVRHQLTSVHNKEYLDKETTGYYEISTYYITTGLTQVFKGTPSIVYNGTIKKYVLVVEFDTPFLYDKADEAIIVDIVKTGSGTALSGTVGYEVYKFGGDDENRRLTIGNDTAGKNALPLTVFTFQCDTVLLDYDKNQQLTVDMNNSPKSPRFELIDQVKNYKLVEGQDYTVSYTKADGTALNSAPNAVGSYVLTIKFTGEYAELDSKTIPFEVKEGFKVTVTVEEKTYNGTALYPVVTVKNTAGQVLTVGKDYALTVNGGKECIDAGSYEVLVTEIRTDGAAVSSQATTFTILPQDVTAAVPVEKTSSVNDQTQYVTVGPNELNYSYGNNPHLPLVTNVDWNSHTQTIIPGINWSNDYTWDDDGYRMSAELNGKMLTSLTLYYEAESGCALTGGNVTVKLMETNSTTLSEYEDTTNATTVFSGEIVYDENTITLNFSTPYEYKGGNLLVDIQGKLTASGSSKAPIKFKGVTYSKTQSGQSTTDAMHRSYGYEGMYNGAPYNEKKMFAPQMSFGYTGVRASAVTIEYTNKSTDWNNKPQGTTATVKDGDEVLVDGTDYVILYNGSETKPSNAGTYSVSVKFIGNYAGTKENIGTFTIKQGTITGVSVEIDHWYECQTPAEPKIKGTLPADAVVTYNYSGNGYNSSTAPTTPGKYTLTMIVSGENGNYVEFRTYVEFTVYAHDYKSVLTAPTCTEDGYTTYTCSKCGDTKTEKSGDELGHDFSGDWTYDESNHWKKCSRCDAIESKEAHSDNTGDGNHDCDICGRGGISEHSYVAVVTAATCTEGGKTTHTCSECNNSYETDETPALNHDFSGDWVIGTDSHWKKCSRCDATAQEAAHSDNTGDKDHNCDTCGAVLTTEHSYGEGVVTKDSTCYSDGEMTYYCDCGHSYTVPYTVRKEHTKGNTPVQENNVSSSCTGTGSYDIVYYCTVKECGAEIERIHYTSPATGHKNVVTDARVEPTCTKDGLTEGSHCETCGTVITAQVAIPMIPHDFSGEWVSDDEGSHAKVCIACGAISELVKCTEGETKVIKDTAATCIKVGTYEAKVYCGDCGYEMDTIKESRPATGHTYSTVWSHNETEHWHECINENCDGIELAPHVAHTITSKITTQATCTAEGVETHSCECGYSYTTPVAKLDHDWADATCTAPKTCKRAGCGATEGTALGHTDAEPLDGHCDRCSILMPVTMTIGADQQGIYTATINGNGTLKMGSNELFSLSSSGAIKLFGVLNEGTYTSTGNYTIKVTVNPTQQMVTVQVTMPDGTVLIRSTYKAVSGNSYTFTTEGVAADKLTNVTVSCEDISVNEYTIVDEEPNLLNDTIYNISTSFTDARIDRAFAWTSTYTGNMTVRYKLAASVADNWLYADALAPVGSVGTEYFYKADINGLCPGTTYQYQIGVKDSENWSETYTFTTGTDNTSSFTFAAIGDTQSHTWEDAKLAQAVIAEVEKINPAFLLHTGDVVENNPEWDPNEWNLYFKALGMFGTSVPHFVASGNHDVWLSSSPANYLFNSHFNHPNNGVNLSGVDISNNGPLANMTDNSSETVYSFDYGEAHIIVLNTGAMDGTNDPKILEAQRQWLIDDLNANKHAKWTILMFHQPVYHRLANSGYDTPALKDIIENPDYGVDLVIQGHSHLVTRTNPMKSGAIVTSADAYKDGDPGKINRNSGVVYITIGSTTTAHDDFTYESYTTNTKEMMLIAVPDNQQASYATFDVSANALKVTIKQLNGLVLDEFEIQGEYTGHNHTVEPTTGKDASCGATGLTEGQKCGICGDIITTQKVIPATGNHTWVDATCTAPKTCSVCGATEGEALGHTWVDATCTVPKTCSVCGASEGDALGHSYNGKPVWNWVVAEDLSKADYTLTIECTKCDAETDGHAKVYTGSHGGNYAGGPKKPTCTEPGSTTFHGGVTHNGEYLQNTYTVEIPATGHTYGEPEAIWNLTGEKPTCTVTFTCGKCNKGTEGNTVTIDAEDITITSETVAPTCTQAGSITYTATYTFGDTECTVTKTVEDGKELGHQFTNYTSTDDARLEQSICDVDGCGATDTRVVEEEAKDKIVTDTPEVDENNRTATSTVGNALLNAIVSAKDLVLQVASDIVDLVFDNSAVGKINEVFNDKEVINVSIVAEDKTEKTEGEDQPASLIFDLYLRKTISKDGETETTKIDRTDFDNGKVTVTIPTDRLNVGENETVKVYYIERDEAGNTTRTEMTDGWHYDRENKKVTFKTNHFSEYEAVAVEETPAGVMVNFVNYTASGANQATIKIGETEVAYAQKTAVEALLGANGEFTVTCAKACVVLVKNGDTYDRVTATLVEGNTYKFKVTPETGMEIVVAIKGDADGNGYFDSTDITALRKSLLEPDNRLYKALNAVCIITADADGNGYVDSTDITKMRKALLEPDNRLYSNINW